MENTTALILPSEADLKKELYAIDKFQALVRANLKEGVDYGVIPGTKKPSLLKPGAEKTTKLLGLADTYEVMQRVEDWDKPFFNYEIKCTLIQIVTGTIISEGLGSCNSWESKYRYRWVWPDDVPQNIDRTKLVKKTGKRRDGKGIYTQYRMDNEDIFSQVNTLLKMAGKRALVDAALHAGRLSELFTQDIEDGAIIDADYTIVEESKTESKEAEEIVKESSGEELAKPVPETEIEPPGKGFIDIEWLKESLKTLRDKKLSAWSEKNLLSYMKTTYKVEAKTVLEGVIQLDKGAANHFVNLVEETLALA